MNQSRKVQINEIPYPAIRISAGFPSPAESYIEEVMDLNKMFIKHPSATFMVTVRGHSMSGAGIQNGDMLIVDRSIKPSNNAIVIAYLDGEFLVKRLLLKKDKIILEAANPDYHPIEITSDRQFDIWGVVVHAIHSF